MDAKRSGKSGLTLLMFADDWGRHASSCQHLARELMARHDIVWVNTIGTRAPRLDVATLRRAWGKFRQWGQSSTKAEATECENTAANDDVVVTNPRMWPWFTKSIDRRINKSLLTKQLNSVIAAQSQPVVAVTTLPITADLVGELNVAKWVYYCGDDFSEWPGLDASTLKTMDTQMLKGSDKIVSVSDRLIEIAAEAGRESELLTHGVHLEHWTSGKRSNAFDEIEGPIVLFWGVIDQRLDMSFVRTLSDRLVENNCGNMVFIGPQQEPDSALLSMPRCHVLPAVTFNELPDLAASADVLMMPYADLPVTRGMQPLKLKEYLATGKPTVVRRLPAVVEWSSCMDVTNSADEFAELVIERLESGVTVDQQTAREQLREESWAAKAAKLEEWILDGLDVGSFQTNRELIEVQS